MITLDEKKLIKQIQEVRAVAKNATIDFGESGLIIRLITERLDAKIGSALGAPWKIAEVKPEGNGLICSFVTPYTELNTGFTVPSPGKRKYYKSIPIEQCPRCKLPGRIKVKSGERGKYVVAIHKNTEGFPETHDITDFLSQIGKTVADVEALIARNDIRPTKSEEAKPRGPAIEILE